MKIAIIIIGIIILASSIFSYVLKRKLKSRTKLTKKEYIKILEKKGFNKLHIETIYDEIRGFLGNENFPMYPEDDIHHVYSIVDLDDETLIDSICEKLNLKIPKQSDCDELNKKFKSFNAEYILTLTKNLAKQKTENQYY